MPEWFDVAKDDQGIISLKVPPSAENYMAEQMRKIDYQGVTVYTGAGHSANSIGGARIHLRPQRGWQCEGQRRPSSANRDQTHGACGPLPLRLAARPTQQHEAAARPGRARNNPPGPTVGRDGPESPGNLPAVGSAGPRAAWQEVGREPLRLAGDFAPQQATVKTRAGVAKQDGPFAWW